MLSVPHGKMAGDFNFQLPHCSEVILTHSTNKSLCWEWFLVACSVWTDSPIQRESQLLAGREDPGVSEPQKPSGWVFVVVTVRLHACRRASHRYYLCYNLT